jgi:hypothetical protein
LRRPGKGRILWAADPVKFAEGHTAVAALYRWALDEAGLKPAFREVESLSQAVLVFPKVLDDAEIDSFSNESLDPRAIRVDFAADSCSVGAQSTESASMRRHSREHIKRRHLP